ncbi:MAG: ABC transporter ATP-binding protein [Peptostreptococcaceae bacterium]
MNKEILKVSNLTKVYPGGVVANYNVNISINEGEVHALIGENGAGKSTLMKMLFGMIPPTSGDIYVDGAKVNFTSSKQALEKGIGMVHQHFMLVPSLSVAENLILGHETSKGGFINIEDAVKQTEEISKKYNLKVDARAKVKDISIAMKQKLEILKALYRGAKILILDEPTAVLTPQEIEELFKQLKLLKEDGYTIIFISHKLHEIKALCDRLTVLRDGQTMGTYSVSELSEQDISKLMVGRDVNLDIEKKERNFQEVVLRVNNLTVKNSFKNVVVNDMSFTVREGQILGVAGIEGNGQSELVNAIIGTDAITNGKVALNNEDITNYSILKRQEMGISHVSEDRLAYGSAPNLSIEDNAISKIYASKELNNKGLLNLNKVKEFTTNLVKEFIVKHDNTKQSIKDLSGGNIQKVIVGREFLYDPKLLIVNQPTRGIDVGAIEFIRHKILDMREQKKAILLISSDLGEVLSLSDSIIVMHEGKIVGYIEDAKNVTEEELGLYMLGVKQDGEDVIGGAYYEQK